MDSNIMKFLEEDEDETMHSGDDVDEFTAALNRDIEGNKSASQPSGSDSAQLSEGSNYGSNQSASQWPSSSQDKLTNPHTQPDMSRFQRQEPHMPAMAGNRLQNPPNQPQSVQTCQVAESQYSMPTQNPAKLQKTSNQQTMATQNPADTAKAPKIRNEIPKEVFLRLMKEIVGDQMMKMALHELQTQDETMHSGDDVDEFTAALNRDIEGNKSASQPSDSNNGSNYGSNQSASQWPSSSQDKLTNPQIQQGMSRFQRQEPHMPAMAGNRLQNPPNQPQRVQTRQVSESQYPVSTQNPANLQKTSNQQTMATQNPANTAKAPKIVTFGQLIPVLVPRLDRDQSMQLQTLYVKLRRNEIPKEGFLRLMKEIVGDQIMEMALYELQTQKATTMN